VQTFRSASLRQATGGFNWPTFEDLLKESDQQSFDSINVDSQHLLRNLFLQRSKPATSVYDDERIKLSHDTITNEDV